MVVSAFPHQTRHLLCLVGAEIGVPPRLPAGTRPPLRWPDGPGTWYRYELTSIGPLGLGPAALTALLASAILAGEDLAGGGPPGGGLAGSGLARGGFARGDLTGGGLAGGDLPAGDLAGGDLPGGDLAGGRAPIRHTTGVPPEAAGAAALSTVFHAKGRLTRLGTGSPGTSPPGGSGPSPPGRPGTSRPSPPGGPGTGAPGRPCTSPLSRSGADAPGGPGTGTPGTSRPGAWPADAANARGTSTPGRWPAAAAGAPAADRHGGTAGHVVVLGADLAVARAAIGLGAERLTLVGVPPARAEGLGTAPPAWYSPALVRFASLGELAEVLAGADGLIQVTPAGQSARRRRPPRPVPAGLLRAEAWVADLAYRPVAAGAAGPVGRDACPAPPGHGDGMLAWQTVGAFRLAAGPRTDAERLIRYLAAVTGTVAGNARAAPVRAAPAR